jgi:chromosome partitioning protein
VKSDSFLARCSRCGYIFTAYREREPNFFPFANLSSAQQAPTEKIIAISNQKGGVAKTSTCLNVGAALAMAKKKVLLVDFDVQANMTISLGYGKTRSFHDAIEANIRNLKDIIIQTKYPHLSLLPSNQSMILLSKKYFGVKNFEYILKDRLSVIKDDYDYIIIDTPPSVDLFTLNALTAAQLVIIPCQCDYLSTHGVDQILKIIDLVKKKTNPTIKAKILVTMYDEASPSSKVVKGKISQRYEAEVFGTAIAHDVKIKEAQIMNMPVLHYDQRSIAGRQYLQMTKELLQQVG